MGDCATTLPLENNQYDSIESYMRDGLRLAQGMGRKSALAGLWWGGGKGLIAMHAASVQGERRKALLEDYGAFLTSLRGCYIGAEDSGISVADVSVLFLIRSSSSFSHLTGNFVCAPQVDVVYSKTRFTTCISPSLGGSGNPSVSSVTNKTVRYRIQCLLIAVRCNCCLPACRSPLRWASRLRWTLP